MIRNADLAKAFCKQDMEMYKLVTKIRDSLYKLIIEEIPNIHLDCHTIATSLDWFVPELQLVHGYQMGVSTSEDKMELMHMSHSWLRLPSGNIIDAYPVVNMSITPILIPTNGPYRYFLGEFYLEKDISKEVNLEDIEYRAKILLKLFQKAQRLGLLKS